MNVYNKITVFKIPAVDLVKRNTAAFCFQVAAVFCHLFSEK